MKKRIDLKKPISEITEEEIKTFCGMQLITKFAIGTVTFFIGIGLCSRRKVTSKIANNELPYTY
ncbi:hypothetical protein [Flavobacterium segetis]|uniref:hypothetical protein n=1 Tax=Flavobacterium segetis TaxID=271157 RepID=UPI0011601FBD|nr:hypothetical protein [Flavobacterium segetis]